MSPNKMPSSIVTRSLLSDLIIKDDQDAVLEFITSGSCEYSPIEVIKEIVNTDRPELFHTVRKFYEEEDLVIAADAIMEAFTTMIRSGPSSLLLKDRLSRWFNVTEDDIRSHMWVQIVVMAIQYGHEHLFRDFHVAGDDDVMLLDLVIRWGIESRVVIECLIESVHRRQSIQIHLLVLITAMSRGHRLVFDAMRRRLMTSTGITPQ